MSISTKPQGARSGPDRPFDGDDQQPGYRSPPGTYEKVLKSVLEDTSLNDAEFRVLMHAAAKPAGWAFHDEKVAEELSWPGKRWPRERARLALRGLRKAGYMALEERRDERGRITGKVTTLRRERVITGWVKLRPELAAATGYQPPAGSVSAGEVHRVNAHPVVNYPLSEYVLPIENVNPLLSTKEANSDDTAAQPAAASSRPSEALRVNPEVIELDGSGEVILGEVTMIQSEDEIEAPSSVSAWYYPEWEGEA